MINRARQQIAELRAVLHEETKYSYEQAEEIRRESEAKLEELRATLAEMNAQVRAIGGQS